MKLYAEICKVNDEQRLVYGYASTEALDSQGERVSKDALAKALPDYMRFANIREMHQASAVGVAKSAEIDETGLYLECKVVDDAAWIKVKEGVYKGFSIGGSVISKSDETITDLRLSEISLVDRPANPEAVIELWKAEAPAKSADEAAIEELAKLLDAGAVKPADLIALAKRDADERAAAEAKKAARPEPTMADVVTLERLAIEKGMDAIACMAGMLQSISWMQRDAVWERDAEGDDSTIPETLKSWLASGADLIRAMLDEELTEMMSADGYAAAIEIKDLAKRAARGGVQKMHDHSVTLGASCSTKGDNPGDLTKTAGSEDLAARVAKLEAELAAKVEAPNTGALLKDALARIKAIEDTPLPAKGVAGPAARITKQQDTGEGTTPSKTLPQPGPDGRYDPLEMMKAVHAAGPSFVVSPWGSHEKVDPNN